VRERKGGHKRDGRFFLRGEPITKRILEQRRKKMCERRGEKNPKRTVHFKTKGTEHWGILSAPKRKGSIL